MKKQILFLFLIGSIAMTGCGLSKTPLSEDQLMYAGKWVSNDGTWIHIYNNGGGDLKSSNSSVEGGQTTIADGKIEIGLFGIKKTFKIDQPPYEENGQMKMKLNGFVYERAN